MQILEQSYFFWRYSLHEMIVQILTVKKIQQAFPALDNNRSICLSVPCYQDRRVSPPSGQNQKFYIRNRAKTGQKIPCWPSTFQKNHMNLFIRASQVPDINTKDVQDTALMNHFIRIYVESRELPSARYWVNNQGIQDKF